MSKESIAISVKGVSKSFRLPHEKHSELRQKILNFGRTKRGYEIQQVLNDISFDIKQGEFFGIVGKNGSGKSTLLKTIAGIYAPDKGKVSIHGKLVPFIELGVGFNPELTGRENVYLNGALLGYSRSEMTAMYDEIVEFAELERFMDQKLKNYSSGMQVRLAFSIAIRAQGDILLLDEVLAVGDAAFQQKCFDYFELLKRQKKTVILVTHSMSNVEKFCTRGLLLNNGRVELIGDSEDIAEAYKLMFSQVEDKAVAVPDDSINSKLIEVTEVFSTQQGNKTKDISALENFSLICRSKINQPIKNLNIALIIKDTKQNILLSTDTYNTTGSFMNSQGNELITTKMEIPNIYGNGTYTIDVAATAELNSGKGSENGERQTMLKQKYIYDFTLSGRTSHVYSMTHPTVKLTTERVSV